MKSDKKKIHEYFLFFGIVRTEREKRTNSAGCSLLDEEPFSGRALNQLRMTRRRKAENRSSA